MVTEILRTTAAGLYCEAGGFWVDPERGVERAVITHAHGDHARPGSTHYLTAAPGKHVVRLRVGSRRRIEGIEYGQPIRVGDVQLSFHPAGHILGSAQVRIEHGGEVWVVSGDYKLAVDDAIADPTCTPFEPVRCDVFVTEASFARPEFRWPPAEETIAAIDAWWRDNRAAGRASLLYTYPLGKTQRILTQIDATIGPIYTHAAVERINEAYRRSAVELPTTTAVHKVRRRAGGTDDDERWAGALIVAPPQARGTRWNERFGPASSAIASGWAGAEREPRRNPVDHQFVLSDHADWDATLHAIHLSGARRVWVTHGRTGDLVRHLGEQGIDARALSNRWDENPAS